MLGYNEHKFALGNINVIHEFDKKSFLANAASYLNESTGEINFKTSYYSKTIADTIQGLKDITLDKEAVREFSKISLLNKTLTPIRPIDYSDVTVINTDMLLDYSDKFKELIDSKIDCKEVTRDSIVSPMVVKKSIVKTTLDYRKPLTDIINGHDDVKKIIPDAKYITSTVIPFVNGFEKTRSNLAIEGKNILTAITTVESDIEKTIARVNNLPNSDQMVRYIEYNGVYNLIDVISYVTYMYVRKVNNFRTNVLNCNRLYTDIVNGNSLSVNEYTTVGSCLNTGVISTTPANLGFNMLQGNVGAYEILANKVYELYSGKNKVDEIDDVVRLGDDIPNHIDGQYTQGDVSYNRDVYDDIKKVFIGIGQGLYNICQVPDGLMIRKDDLIGNSGFKLALKDRFRSKIDSIDDISKIQHADIVNRGNVDLANIDELLSEVKDFSRNMLEIAGEAIDAHAILEEIMERFDYNINNEFKNVDAVKELEEWAKMFNDEYIEFVNDIAGRFMNRLANLAIVMKNIDDQMTPIGEPSNVVSKAFAMLDVTDYLELATESSLDYDLYLNHLEFEAIEMVYQSLRIEKETGYNLIFEADEDKAEKPVVKAKFSGDFSANVSGSIEKLKFMISKWFDKLTSAFTESINKLANSQAVKDINANANKIIALDYNSIPAIEIYPYSGIAPGTIVDNLNKLRNNIKAINPQVIQGIQSENDLYAKLFPFIDGFNSQGDLSSQSLWFNKTGNANPSQVKSYQGDEFKTFVQNDMIPFVRDYTTTYHSTLKNAIDAVKDDLTQTVAQYKTTETPGQGTPQTTTAKVTQFKPARAQPVAASDSSIEFGLNMFEADEPNKNTQTSMSSKANWMNKAVQVYCGSVMNAIRDRHNDYIKILSRLANVQNPNETQPTA